MSETLDLFPNAPIRRARPVEPIVRSAVLDGPYRWELRRAWGAGPPVGWVLLNPSVADGYKDDPTCIEMMKHSLRLGFGSMVAVNIYAYRATDPRDLKRWIGRRSRPTCAEMTFENGEHAGRVLRPVDTIIVGWGNHARRIDVECFLETMAYAKLDESSDGIFLLEDGDEMPFPLWCLGTTESGAPKHPLARGKHRIPADQPLIPWKP